VLETVVSLKTKVLCVCVHIMRDSRARGGTSSQQEERGRGKKEETSLYYLSIYLSICLSVCLYGNLSAGVGMYNNISAFSKKFVSFFFCCCDDVRLPTHTTTTTTPSPIQYRKNKKKREREEDEFHTHTNKEKLMILALFSRFF